MSNGPIKDEHLHYRAAVNLMRKLHASLQDFACYSFSLPAREVLEPFEWKPDVLSARLSQAALQASPAIAYYEDPADYLLRIQKPWDWLRIYEREKGPLGSWYRRLDPIFKGFPEEGVPFSTENDPKQTLIYNKACQAYNHVVKLRKELMDNPHYQRWEECQPQEMVAKPDDDGSARSEAGSTNGSGPLASLDSSNTSINSGTPQDPLISDADCDEGTTGWEFLGLTTGSAKSRAKSVGTDVSANGQNAMSDSEVQDWYTAFETQSRQS